MLKRIIAKLKEYLLSKLDHRTDEAPAFDYSRLNWCYGGFHGENATESKTAIISSLNVSKSKLSYRWEKGGCEALGANFAQDASETLACLFCLHNGEWKGGKFDWISTSRTTRDLYNIETGYKGWEYDVFAKAEAYAFVIVSKDGKSRTNVIEETK